MQAHVHRLDGIGGIDLALIALSLLTWWPRKAAVSARAMDSAPIARAIPGAWADKIVAAHLFGQAQTKLAVATAAALPITVDGIAAASNPKDSIAVLTLKGTTGEFHVGDRLPDGEQLAAIGPDSLELADGGTLRRIALAHYGTPDSEGPAAYAALLHGIGLSSSASNSGDNQQNASGTFVETGVTGNVEQPLSLNPVSMSNVTPVQAVGIVHIPAQATPLEQLQALRAQLIHPR
ncbi:MAG: type II secretion system protein N [Gammaproteobacteria bacterium]